MGSMLESIEPDQLALLATVFAIAATDGLTSEESATISAFLMVVSDVIALISAQQQLLEGASR